jgi:large subunit ribosomal protein L3
VLKLENCQVVGQRTQEGRLHGCSSVPAPKAKNVNQGRARPLRQGFAKVEPKRQGRRVPCRCGRLIDVGAEITADHFVAGQKVDVTGTSSARASPAP